MKSLYGLLVIASNRVVLIVRSKLFKLAFHSLLMPRILTFRRSKHNQTTNQMIVQVKDVTDREKARALVGKSVVWKNPIGKNKLEIKGKVQSPHGNKGAIRVLFEKGMPGQSITTEVTIE